MLSPSSICWVSFLGRSPQIAAAVHMSTQLAVLFFIFQLRIMNTTAGAKKGQL